MGRSGGFPPPADLDAANAYDYYSGDEENT